MTPGELAESRSRTWGLLGRLLLEGPTPATAAWVAAIPSLHAASDPLTPDEHAAQHEAVLGREVFPYQSVWTSRDGQFGGDVSSAVQRSYDAMGFCARREGVEPDHIGMQLLAMAFLCGAEADAWRDGLASLVPRLQRLQAQFVADHLGSWLPALSVALSNQGVALYAEVGALAVELLASHEVDAQTHELPDPIDVLEAPKAGLATVSRALLIPGRTGWFLSRADIGRIGQSLDLPHGFGTRWKMLETLLVTGVDHGRAGEVLDAFDAEAARWDAAYERFEALGLHLTPWRARLSATRVVFATLRDAAG